MHKLTLPEFVANFAEQFEDTNPELISSDTEFRQLDEWCSMMALTIIAMCDAEYDVKLKGDDIKNSVTVEHLFNIIASRVK